MNILIIGASQGTGALAAGAALKKGHRVTAFARDPLRLTLEHPQLQKVCGDFQQPTSVEAAVAGQDAVIVTAAATRRRALKDDPRYSSRGTARVIQAMKRGGVRRLVALSAFGVGETRRLLNPVMRALEADFLMVPFEDHERQEELVRESGLDWVIARPTRFTNGPARARYLKKTAVEPVPGSISRADVASFLVEACEARAWVGHAVQLGG
jgi:uncharacterized protein YbjT (DUF2867 family)